MKQSFWVVGDPVYFRICFCVSLKRTFFEAMNRLFNLNNLFIASKNVRFNETQKQNSEINKVSPLPKALLHSLSPFITPSPALSLLSLPIRSRNP